MQSFNYNIIGYSIFLLIIAYIILIVGKICYKNGNVYVAELIPNHQALCLQINKTLLTGYYLVNLGYSAMTLMQWQTINNLEELIETVATKTAVIAFILSVLHYLNIYLLTHYIQKIIK